MGRDPLDSVPIWLFSAVVCAVIGLAMEGGYRLGRWRHAQTAEEKEGPVGTMVGSVLALLAFMLAFTFGMAGSRFEARRQSALDEANAVGTAYLRTRLLPEPQRGTSGRLLREYVDVRVRGLREGRLAEVVTRSEELHGLLWAEAVTAAERQPGPITGLYVQALNEMIDLHATRVQVGLRSRIPGVIWAGLLSLALLGMAAVGYQSGLAATRRSPAMLTLVVAFAGVLFLIVDLDRPGEGLLVVSQEAMHDLQRTMTADNP